MNYTGFGRSPTSSLIEETILVPRLNALKFLQWGMEEEVGDGEGLPEWSFQESDPWNGGLAALI